MEIKRFTYVSDVTKAITKLLNYNKLVLKFLIYLDQIKKLMYF